MSTADADPQPFGLKDKLREGSSQAGRCAPRVTLIAHSRRRGRNPMLIGFALLQASGLGLSAIALIVVAIFVVSLILSAIKIVKEYERGVIFRLGRVQGGAKGPGLFILFPFVDKMVKIDLRTVTMEVPPQEIITRDNVPARVTAVIYFRVVDPNRSVIEVENHVLATSQISQTTLRSVLGQRDLDDLLTN